MTTTTTRTPSQLGRANRNRGHQAERDLVRWLRTNGFPHAERAVRTGYRTPDRTSPDPGDITGTPGVTWSVKDCTVERTKQWQRELAGMGGSEAAVELLVVKRRGHANPGQWWCWLTLPLLLDLAGSTTGTKTPCPVRMNLGDVVALLRADGYGAAVSDAS